MVEREKDVLADKFRQQGKPANVIEKIVEFGPQDLLQGSLPARAAVTSSTTRRPWRRRSRKPKARSAAPIKVTGFVRYALGEGIEKQESDFAAEVAAAAGQS